MHVALLLACVLGNPTQVEPGGPREVEAESGDLEVMEPGAPGSAPRLAPPNSPARHPGSPFVDVGPIQGPAPLNGLHYAGSSFAAAGGAVLGASLLWFLASFVELFVVIFEGSDGHASYSPFFLVPERLVVAAFAWPVGLPTLAFGALLLFIAEFGGGPSPAGTAVEVRGLGFTF